MGTVYTEWLNQNSYRAYPFREDSNRNAIGEYDLTLPNYLFTDFVITVASTASFRLQLTQVACVGGFITFVFSTMSDDTVCTLAVNANEHTANQAYQLVGQDDYEDCRGKAVLGDLSKLPDDLPDGTYNYQLELEPAVVRPDIRGVRSLQLSAGDTLSDYIFGRVKLIEGSNIQLTYLPDVNGIRIDAISGAGLNDQCECDEEYQLPECVRRINGINVEDVQLIGDGKCVEVDTSGNTITISDTCSEPCCGCTELEFITTNLDLLQSTLKRVEEYADTLHSKLLEMIQSMLAATRGG